MVREVIATHHSSVAGGSSSTPRMTSIAARPANSPIKCAQRREKGPPWTLIRLPIAAMPGGLYRAFDTKPQIEHVLGCAYKLHVNLVTTVFGRTCHRATPVAGRDRLWKSKVSNLYRHRLEQI